MASRDVTLTDGARLRVEDDGEGPPLLLVTGLGGTAGYWTSLVPELARGRRVIRFDQRGVAASTRGTAHTSVERLASDALEVLRALDLTGVVVLGHSTGGCIAQAMAVEDASRLEALILAASWIGPNRYMDALFRARRTLLRADPRAYAELGALLGYPPDWLDAHWEAFEAAAKGALTDPAAIEAMAERIGALLAYDGAPTLARVALPCLVLGAEDDLIVPAYLQRELAAALGNPPVRMLDGGGHFFPLTRRGEFLEAAGWTGA